MGGKAIHALLNNEGRDPSGTLVWLGLCIDNECIGYRPIRNPITFCSVGGIKVGEDGH